MPKRPCYWTRKLELDLVEFVRHRDYIWKPVGNTNHHIQLKYKAYAEFAASIGRSFTARSVRDRWVNIRSTFSHNLRKVDRSKLTAKTPADIYVPCWPLWKPLQFLRDGGKKEDTLENCHPEIDVNNVSVKEEFNSEVNDNLSIRQSRRTDRPRHRPNKKQSLFHPTSYLKLTKPKKDCKQVIDDLLQAMKPLITEESHDDKYLFFGKHITEQLSSMRKVDADSACQDILKLFNQYQPDST